MLKKRLSPILMGLLFCFHTLCAAPAEQEFLPSVDGEGRIEFYTMKPEGEGPFPVMFLLHGWQPPETSNGGKQLVEYHYTDRFIKQGIVAVSISMPGFGLSDGERDRGGLYSQKSLAKVINHFKALLDIDNERMGVYGISLGAILASMAHTHCPDLALQILEAGRYDCFFKEFPEYLSGIPENIQEITGGSEEELKLRSAVYYTDKVNAATLLLQGEFDDRRGLPSAKALHQRLLDEDKESYLKIFPNKGHCLFHEKWGAILPFVREQFFHKYGIGVDLAPGYPAIQILKIHPRGPADQSGRLRGGDVIHAISPNNDTEEVDALDMPLEKLVPLILGKKGTKLRLRVQHFDLSFDDVVVERGSSL